MDLDVLFSPDSKISTKSLIINILATNDLKITDIQKTLRKEANKKISYQAIRQALVELIEKEVVVKKEEYYSINKTWVVKIKNWAEIVETTLNKQKIKKIDKNTTQISLKNLDALGYFILHSLERKFFDSEDKIYLHLNHLWIPFSNVDNRNELVRIFSQHKMKVIINEKSTGDKILSNWYKKHGEVVLGVKKEGDCEYIVQGDCVVQIFMNNELKQKMNEVYSLKGILNLGLFEQIIEMTHKEYEIELIITRNKNIASNLKKAIENTK